MKVRLDFVTNSSSSSYIFKDRKEFEKAGGYDGTEIYPLSEFEEEDLLEVFEWYEHKIYENIFGEEVTLNPGKEILRKVEEKLRPVTLILMFLCVTQKWIYGRYNTVPGKILQKEFEQYIWDMLLNPFFLYDEVLEYAVCNYCTEIVEIAKEYENMHVGDILSELLGAKYMYFSELETPSEKDKWLRSIKDCIYACNHMG